LTRSLIPTAGSPACMTLREIRSNCGNLQCETLHARLLNSSGMFLDFSWGTGKQSTWPLKWALFPPTDVWALIPTSSYQKKSFGTEGK
jgi:hypothetical protein